MDFNKDKLEKKLFDAGYDRNLKTFFIWEGVTMYLTTEAVDDILAFVAKNSGPGSSIIFDYIFKSFLDETIEFEGVHRIERVWKAYERLDKPITDERFTFGIPEGTIREFLSRRPSRLWLRASFTTSGTWPGRSAAGVPVRTEYLKI